jgi:hypothetical protein
MSSLFNITVFDDIEEGGELGKPYPNTVILNKLDIL